MGVCSTFNDLFLESLSNGELTGEATGITVIQDPLTIQKIYTNLVAAAKKEILLFLPTTSSLLRENKIGIIQSLIDAATRGIKIRIIVPGDEKFVPNMEAILSDERNGIRVRRTRHNPNAQATTEARTKILIIDRREYLVVELKDDSKETFVDAVRLALYSDTKSTVFSYLMLFENLWEQSELYDQLEMQDKLQKEFINIAAHDLRTPIQPILGMLEMLEDEFSKNHEKVAIEEEDFELLLRNAKRLERLSSAILEASRIESNSIKLQKETFDINEKIKNVIRDVKGPTNLGGKLEIMSKNVEPIFVEADKVRTFEIISNLITNAIKFTREGTIIVNTKRHNDMVQIDVEDTGIGIDPSVAPKLFSKFATTSEQGTGLGLYVSKKIIEAHGGRIWAENNKDGKGATFSFTLPLAQSDPTDPQ